MVAASTAARAAARSATRAARGAAASAEAGTSSGAKIAIAKKPGKNLSNPKIQETVSPVVVSSWEALRFPRTAKPIQGKVRETGSRAALQWRTQERARLRKALHRLTHGKNIFAYNNIRTNQVVYSFTRELEKNNVLSQLVYHGKKTVPATLRKDMWTPYFSLHFPSTSLGLEAYRLLREFSMQRQLAPPADMITASQDNEVLTRQRPRDPAEAEKWDEEWKIRMEQHQFLNKKLRARILMDQKATSVADVAAVLALQQQKMKEEQEREARENELEDENEEETEEVEGGDGEKVKNESGKVGDKDKTGKKISRKRRKRIQAAIRAQQALEKDTMDKIAELERMLQVKIDPSLPPSEHHIVNEGEVKMFWVDLHNLQYAESWPKNVIHGQLKPVRGHIMGTELDLAAGELLALGGAPAAKGEDGEGAEQAGAGSGTLAKADTQAEGEQEKADAPKEEKSRSGLGKLKFW
ncbi:hypothetical protein I7I51_06256 [Histoplasma capsulatum]|uniref:Large ribosomal subunit protein mL67 n=1 Tax=Ajellomyces capsulatus TaxID=5037 RepID=A0A8A1ML81_AJECA|nr:predicted protein [Histoplasma mississippiense (nom. inval.)]EDN05879.1 predicted protein [Histoplasma mississippiense (nom. inval.)]QSS65413.1 hypothetical protein I7I51_06256 [Histoplasma capsulatum]